MTYAGPAAAIETLRRPGRKLQKYFSGTLGETRRRVAINLWGAARQADLKNTLYAKLWTGEKLETSIDGKKYSLKKGDFCIYPVPAPHSWDDILTKGCPHAIGTIHCLLGGSIGIFNKKDWLKTMVTIASMDGWYPIERALKST